MRYQAKWRAAFTHGENRRFILLHNIGRAGGKGAHITPFVDRIRQTLPGERVITSDEADDSAAGLARHLVAFEAEFAAQRPARVTLGDASDAALAAALVATKMLIALEATPAARDASALNGRLIAQLVPTYTEVA